MTMPGKRHYRFVAAVLFIIISAAITVANGFTSSCARQGTSRSNLMMSSSSKMIEGYEYIHPDIAQMLTGDGILCNNFDPTTKQSSFPFRVDPDTLTLQLKQQGTVSMGYASIMPIDQLHHFANHCDDIVFGGNTNTLNVQKKIFGLICLSQLSSTPTSSDSSSRESTSAIVVASMVSANLLESSIRSALLQIRPQNSNHQTKGAPLLSNMIAEMSKLDTDPSLEYNKLFPLARLSPILKTLLLPTKVGGINLRNLLSHGFLSALDRRWLSLTLVLIQTLDSCWVSVDDTKMITKQRDISSLTNYDPMKSEVDYGKDLLSSSSRMHGLESASCTGDFVPSSHQNLFRFTLHELGTTCLSSPMNTQTIPPLTAIFITSMSSLLEHSLRLVWCRVNDRMEESIARPASYYVTLDGHGQKDKHEVMISPYLCDDYTRNKLVTAVGAQTCALLTDLFASPSSSEGPNIRAAVCHGYFDDAILEELASLADWASHREQNVPLQDRNDLKDAACALVSVFDLISSNLSQGQPRMTEYKPLFSYTSMAMRDLNGILGNLASLSLLMKNDDEVSGCIDKMGQQHKSTFADISSMKVDLREVHSLAYDLFPSLNANNTTSTWEIDDFYADHNMNIIMADCNAAQTLLADLSNASKHYLEIFEAGVGGLTSEPTSTKDRRAKKSLVRLCGVSSLVLDFYCMAAYVALFAIDHHNNSSRLQLDCNLDRADVIKAVERSRMTLSTFDSYLSTNMERSIKSLTQYLQGKSVKKVLLHNQQQ